MLTSPRTIAIAAALFAVTALAVAQQRTEDAPRAAAKPAASSHSVDSFIVGCLTNKNQNEIAIAKIAQQQSKNESVKEFAGMMIKEHSQFLNQLEQFNGHGSAKNASAAPAKSGDTLATLKQIGDEVSQRCLATAKAELQKKEGAEFDKCFMGMQVAAHLGMVDELTVLRHHTSGELKEVIGKGLETSQTHLAHAKKIMNEIKDKDSATASRDKESSKQ